MYAGFSAMMPFTATFFIGVPDNQTAKISGFSNTGGLMYSLDGNAQFHHYLNIPKENKSNILLLAEGNTSFQLGKTNIIVNCITDPDSNAKTLQKMVAIAEHVHKHHPHCALFNDPAKIAATSRDNIYKRYHTLPAIHLPKTIRITPKSTRDVVRLAEENEVGYPFLIRSCGSHQSHDLQLIASPEHHDRLEYYAYNGSKYYLTEFVDYRSDDGLYRKGRLVFIGEEIFPRHYMTSSGWEVHSNANKPDMAQNILREEALFVRNFRDMLHPTTLASFQTIYEQSGLDYLGFDFAIRSDGTALIFEINPAQNPFMPLKQEDPSYLPFVMENIIAGFNRSIRAKVEEKRALIPNNA